MMLMPANKDTCPICATTHGPEWPHDNQSLYYQYRFYGVRGRWPTWADAIAHCSNEMKSHWEQVLRERGMWSEPNGDEPIADPPAESFHQAVGDTSSHGFGPSPDALD